MGSVSFTYTFTGAEVAGSEFYFAPIQTWTGNYTCTFALDGNAGAIINFFWGLRRSSDVTSCWEIGLSFGSSNASIVQSQQVNNPPASWHCNDWDTFYLKYNSATNRLAAGRVLTITFDGVGITPTVGICEYGTMSKSPGESVIDMVPAAVGIIARNPLSVWSYPLALAVLTHPIQKSILCSKPPPPDEDLAVTDFGTIRPPFQFPEVNRKMSIKLTRLLWDQYCQCAPPPPGRPAPNNPGTTNITQPTWYITNTYNTVSNTDIANTLNLILTIHQGNTYITNQLAQRQADCCDVSNGEYEHGDVHAGLVGEGNWAIGQLVGFLINVTGLPTGQPILPGQPDYLWNCGWMSILDDEGLLEEKRITRDGQLWFPSKLAQAERFAFTLKGDTEISVTELVPPAEIRLME